MSLGKIAAAATTTIAALVAVTFFITQINVAANRFQDCVQGSVAGGAIGGPFDLINQHNQMVTDQSLITKPTLIYFGYTFCPDVCPVDVSRNAVAIDILDDMNIDVQPVFVTIDPARDTPEELAAFAGNMHPKMIALTGSAEQISKIARAYKVYYRKQDSDDPEYYLVDHSTFSYLMLPDEGFVQFFRNDLGSKALAEQISCYVQAA